VADAPAQKLGFTLRQVGDRLYFDQVSEAFASRLGLTTGDLAGLLVSEALPAAVAHSLMAAGERCAAGGRSARWMQAMPLPSGRRLWRVALSLASPEGAAVRRINGAAHEIGDAAEARALARPRAAAETAKPRQVFRFVVRPRASHLEFVTANYFRYTGLAPDADREDMFSRVHPDDVARVALMTDAESSCSLTADVRLLGADRKYRTFRLNADLVHGLAGRRWYGVLIEHDAPTLAEQAPRAEALLPAALQEWRLEIDRAWRILDISPAAAAFYQAEPARLIGEDARKRLIPLWSLVQQAIQSAFTGGHIVTVEVANPCQPSRLSECRIRGSANGAVVSLVDITERRAAEWAIEGLEPINGFGDTVAPEMLLLDENGAVISVNAACLASMADVPGAPPSHGRLYADVCRTLAPEIDPQVIRTAVDDLVRGRIQRFVHTFVNGGGGGAARVLRVRIFPLSMGAALRLVVLQEDLTGMARTEAALREATEQVLSAQEEERKRLAIELHDSTSQHLVAVGLGMAKLRRIVGTRPQTQEVLDDVSRSLEEAIREIRIFSYLMKPAGLNADGLLATARSFVNGFGRRTGLHTTFRAEGPIDEMSEAAGHVGFRLIQEALSNVYRHAEAHGVEVELAHRGGSISVRIADDGKGIGSLEADPGRIGVGIAGMQARVSQLGGDLEISSDGAGTVVLARFPADASLAATV
jgi:signal transduction histidine kinase/PAS domain-containing protein